MIPLIKIIGNTLISIDKKENVFVVFLFEAFKIEIQYYYHYYFFLFDI